MIFIRLHPKLLQLLLLLQRISHLLTAQFSKISWKIRKDLCSEACRDKWSIPWWLKPWMITWAVADCRLATVRPVVLARSIVCSPDILRPLALATTWISTSKALAQKSSRCKRPARHFSMGIAMGRYRRTDWSTMTTGWVLLKRTLVNNCSTRSRRLVFQRPIVKHAWKPLIK